MSILPLIMCMLLTVVTTHFDWATALKLATAEMQWPQRWNAVSVAWDHIKYLRYAG